MVEWLGEETLVDIEKVGKYNLIIKSHNHQSPYFIQAIKENEVIETKTYLDLKICLIDFDEKCETLLRNQMLDNLK